MDKDIILENRDMPQLVLEARMMPESIDEENRTVRVQYTTGARVFRQRYFEDDYYEELSTEKGHVRLDRLKAGAAPVLNSHKNTDLADVMGRVIDADETHATLKFSKRAELEGFWQDIRDGILGNVSVGYMVYRYQDVTPDGDKVRVLRAIDWEPFEISMVSVPADAGAGVRSKQTNRCVVIGERAENFNKGQNAMDKDTEKNKASAAENETRGTETNQPAATPAPAAPAPADTAAAEQRGAVAERTRTAEIHKLVRSVGLETSVADEMVEKGISLDAARAQILDKLATHGEDTQVRTQVRVTQDEGDVRVAALENAIMHRYAPGENKLSDAGKQFRGMSLMEIARDCIGYKESRGLSKNEIALRALHSTSDFTHVLANVANKSLRRGYDNTKRTFMPFCRQVTLPDFKQVQRTALSNGPNLKRVVEGGEYEYGTFTDESEVYRLFTYGRICAITREAIINDDMDAFTRIPEKMAAAAGRLENRMVYDILLGNPEMADGTALFHADHGNLTNKDLGIPGLGALRTLMRTQTDPSSEDTLNYEAKFLIVPAALELEAMQLQGQFMPTEAGKVNPYRNNFEIIVEGYLDSVDAVSYYGAADPAQADTIEYAYLEGETGPYIESREGFTRDGMEIKVRHDFATKAIDFRGLAKSTNNE